MKLRKLIVNWQHESEGSVLPVAELLATRGPEEARFEFGYIEGVREALEHGFQPFLAFPNLHRRYTGLELFPFFRNRVLSKTRPDYAAYVEALGLSVQTANEVDLLGRSTGRRQTDRVETVLAAEPDPDTGRYVAMFLARGIRYVEDAESVVSRLQVGCELAVTVETTNEYNPRARQLRFEGEALGYVVDYLLADLDALDAAHAVPRFIVERVNPPPYPHHNRLLVRLEAEWPSGFEPFDDPKFRPYVDTRPTDRVGLTG